MEFQVSYFKSWKMILWKCCTQYISKYGKPHSGHRMGKGQFSFQSQRKAITKNTHKKCGVAAQPCPTPCNPMDCSLPGSSIHGIFQVRTLEWEVQFSSVQSLSCVRLFATPWIAACQASVSITTSQSLSKLMSIESVMPSNHLILCRPLLLLPSIFPSSKVFSSESALHIRWPNCWSFSFRASSSKEYSGLIFSRIDWFDLLAVQGTLKSLLQHHSSKASVLQRSAFFSVQLSHLYMTPGKTCMPIISQQKWGKKK